jgi:hypothetical protein
MQVVGRRRRRHSLNITLDDRVAWETGDVGFFGHVVVDKDLFGHGDVEGLDLSGVTVTGKVFPVILRA